MLLICNQLLNQVNIYYSAPTSEPTSTPTSEPISTPTYEPTSTRTTTLDDSDIQRYLPTRKTPLRNFKSKFLAEGAEVGVVGKN